MHVWHSQWSEAHKYSVGLAVVFTAPPATTDSLLYFILQYVWLAFLQPYFVGPMSRKVAMAILTGPLSSYIFPLWTVENTLTQRLNWIHTCVHLSEAGPLQ